MWDSILALLSSDDVDMLWFQLDMRNSPTELYALLPLLHDDHLDLTEKQIWLCQLPRPKTPWWIPVVLKSWNLLMCFLGPARTGPSLYPWPLILLTLAIVCFFYSHVITSVPPTTGLLYRLSLHLVKIYLSFRYQPTYHSPEKNFLQDPRLC